MIVPLRTGGGTRIKILDGWAAGVPVVTTSLGCEGLRVEDGSNIVIADDPARFASAVAGLLGDRARGVSIGEAGHATVRKYNSWQRLTHRLVESYASFSQGGPRGDSDSPA